MDLDKVHRIAPLLGSLSLIIIQMNLNEFSKGKHEVFNSLPSKQLPQNKLYESH